MKILTEIKINAVRDDKHLKIEPWERVHKIKMNNLKKEKKIHRIWVFSKDLKANSKMKNKFNWIFIFWQGDY